MANRKDDPVEEFADMVTAMTRGAARLGKKASRSGGRAVKRGASGAARRAEELNEELDDDAGHQFQSALGFDQARQFGQDQRGQQGQSQQFQGVNPFVDDFEREDRERAPNNPFGFDY